MFSLKPKKLVRLILEILNLSIFSPRIFLIFFRFVKKNIYQGDNRNNNIYRGNINGIQNKNPIKKNSFPNKETNINRIKKKDIINKKMNNNINPSSTEEKILIGK